MREIVLDTETTGLDPRKGDRLVEIGCVELIHRIPTGREYHVYINPEREVPAEAERVHGLSTAFLADKPVFKTLHAEFLEFIGHDPLVIHNAAFDIGFINMELERVGRPAITFDRVIDTLQLARRKHPAGPNTLDALCKRYGIDNSQRIKHGALMDSVLLADVYIELLGERQAALGLGERVGSSSSAASGGRRAKPVAAVKRPAPLPSPVTEEQKSAHRAFVDSLGPKALWLRYFPVKENAA